MKNILVLVHIHLGVWCAKKKKNSLFPLACLILKTQQAVEICYKKLVKTWKLEYS